MKIYNMLSKDKQEFIPIWKGHAGIYVCGPTVYDSFHLGHARSAVAFDVLYRYLCFSGYQVTYVTNFTDIDDKIVQRSLSENRPWRGLTQEYINEYYSLLDSLNVLRASAYPKCSDYIEKMVVYIRELVKSGHAYPSEGDVYFDISTATDYGKLSGRTLNDQREGASGRTGDETERKRNSNDFVLWKSVKPKTGPSWESPFGNGRPGWHIECSVMSREILGGHFDIHGGGQDLVFPHHENELAQSLAHGDKSANYWMHNGFVGYDFKSLPSDVVEKIRAEQPEAIDAKGNIKLGKSLWKYLEPLGLAQWLKDMLQPRGTVDPMAVRMAFLGVHYRKPIQVSQSLLDESGKKYARLVATIGKVDRILGTEYGVSQGTACQSGLMLALKEAKDSFKSAMDNDLNTALAISGLFKLDKEITGYMNSFKMGENCKSGLYAARSTMVSIMETLGLRTDTGKSPKSSEESLRLLKLLRESYSLARSREQYWLSDSIRDSLSKLGYSTDDTD